MQMTFRKALAKAHHQILKQDSKSFVFGLDVDDHKEIFGSLEGLLKEFGPTRVFGTPLSEESMTGIAIGAALAGMRPIHCHIRADFALLAMNQLINMASNIHYLTCGQLHVPLVIRMIVGRGWGQGAQHSKSLQSLFAHIPGLKVVMPATPQDAFSLLLAAHRDENPVVFLEHRWLYDVEGPVSLEKSDELAKCEILNEGSELTLVATSWMVFECLQAAGILKEHGVSAEVINVKTISPLDFSTIEASVNKTGRLLVADYDWLNCGFSAEVISRTQENCFEKLKTPCHRLGFASVPCPTARALEDHYYPSAKAIITTAFKMLKKPCPDLAKYKFYNYETRFRGPF